MRKRIVAFLLALVLVLACTAASAATYYRLKTSVKLRYLPNYNAQVLDVYRTDWALTVNKKIDSTWASITFSNGRIGYIERNKYVSSKSYAAWVTKDGTKVYHGPAYSFATLETINRGDRVTVLTQGSVYNYVKTASGTYGYVANGSLSKKKTSPTPSEKKETNYKAWVVSNGGTVGLRTAPSGSNSVVYADIKRGTEILVIEYDKNFCYVSVDGAEGYMRTKYISKIEPAPLPVPDPDPVFVPYTTTAKQDNKGNSPRLYQGEGLGWSSVKLSVGETVDVVAKAKDIYWVKVEVDGRKGYMPLKFLN